MSLLIESRHLCRGGSLVSMAGRGLPASLPGDMGVRGLLSPSVCCAFRFRNFVDMRLRSEPRRLTLSPSRTWL